MMSQSRVGLTFSLNMVAKVMKNGTIAIKSIVFMMSLMNSIFEGHAIIRSTNSKLNHTMHSDSTMKNGFDAEGTSSSKTRVLLSCVKKICTIF